MELAHDEDGSGAAVVLLHAGLADRSMWDELLPALAEAGYRAIAIDLPGFGESAVAHELDPWNDVLETMDALDVDQAVLVGNSWGGAVALRVAVLAPERVSALVLVSAPPAEDEPTAELEDAWDAEEAALASGDTEAAVAAVLDAWLLPDAPEELRSRVAAMQRRTFQLQDMAAEPRDAPDPVVPAAATLGGLPVPALVAVGEHDMADFHAEADSLAELLPHARHAVIAGARHLAPLEQPLEFQALLLDFLRNPD